ncbi:LysR family transcriptional regulator [Bowmanella pacifica]|nr:LysR family transcriptional regulator [Bowmanella pacifica]
MKIDDLKLFMLVVELGGFSSAADALNLPRSNVSRRVNELEQQLNVKLLTRTTRRLTLTPTGLEYYQSLQNIIPQLDQAHEAIRTHSHSPSGKIKIGLLNESDILIHEILQSFLQKYPNIRLETHLSGMGYHDILNYGLDACVHIGSIDDSSFIARPITPFKRKMYASRGYVEKHGRPQKLEDLQQHFLLMLRWTDGRLENNWVFNKGSVKVDSRLIANSSYYIRHAVFQGDGIGVLPEVMAKPFVQTGEIIDLLPEYEMTLDDLWLVYPSRKGLSYAARLFIDYVLEEVAKIQ